MLSSCPGTLVITDAKTLFVTQASNISIFFLDYFWSEKLLRMLVNFSNFCNVIPVNIQYYPRAVAHKGIQNTPLEL